MRAQVIIGGSILAWIAGLSFAQAPAAPPTRVCQTGIYGCPAHSGILATWPARCPLCETVLEAGPPPVSTAVGVTPAADRDDQRPGEVTRQMQQEQRWRERQRRNEQWRQWGQRNEELRERARRNAALREQVRRNEELGQQPPSFDDHPPEGYAYPYPYNYQYNPRTGRYEYLSPGPGYPYGGYQYNPNPGERYYHPNADQYYYNPNMGHYFYNPNTGQYVYVNPRDAFTPINLGPGIDMDNRRRQEEEESAREAQRNEELNEQARRNAEPRGRYPGYGYAPPGAYPYTYPAPGSAPPYPYGYYNNPYPRDARWYGGYSYNPNTGPYYYNPRAGQYYYNPRTGQYDYITPGYAYPNPRTEERPERQERQRR
jgi:hypothetical protein